MKRAIITLLIAIFYCLHCAADVNTDRAMSKILRDTKTYLSAEARASTEKEAYESALQSLTSQITDYLKEKEGKQPDAVFLNNISSIYDILTNRISSNRYRVVLYVKKSDLYPIDGTENSMVLTRDKNGRYESVTDAPQQPAVVTDTIVHVVRQPVAINPVITQISQCQSGKEVPVLLKSLRVENKISGASAFPIAHINDFYIAVIDKNDKVIAILKQTSEGWVNAFTFEQVNIERLRDCNAFWFTLTN